MNDLVRQAMGLPAEEPEKPRVPAFSRADQVPNQVPLAPQVRANIRRVDADPRQLSWDVSTSPEAMLEALKGSGSLRLPVARFMEETKRVFDRATGGNAFAIVDQRLLYQALHSSARLLHNGDVKGAVMFLTPIRRVLTPGAMDDQSGLESVRRALCDVVRALYPCAPDGWNNIDVSARPLPPALPPVEPEHLALPGPPENEETHDDE